MRSKSLEQGLTVWKHRDFKGGWWIGNFEPSVCKTKHFEVGLKKHEMNSKWPKHYHPKADEWTHLLYGRMKINGHEFSSGDIFHCAPGYTVQPEFLTDCWVVIVKSPSVPNDKVVVNDSSVPNRRKRKKVQRRRLPKTKATY